MAFGAGGLFGAYRIGVQLNLASNIAQQSSYINRDLMAMQARMRELQAQALQTRAALNLAGSNAERAALSDSIRLQNAAIAGQRAQLLLTQNQAVKERELFNQRKSQMAELNAQRASVGGQVSGLVTAGAVGLGLASGAALVTGVEGAAKLQLAMQTVAEATGATTDQLAKLNAMVLDTSDVTAQSADTIAREMAAAATAGLSSFGRLYSAFPQIARFVDVQWFRAQSQGRNIDPAELTSIGVQFAHYFQAYSGAALTNMLNDLNRIMFTQPEAMQRLLTQGKYFIPLATRLGMSEPQIMDMLASMGQTGFLRGKGGTGVQNTLLGAINVATMTAHLQGARLKALVDLGLIDSKTGKKTFLDANGNIDTALLFGMLTASAQHMQPTQYIADLSNAFGKQATQFLSVFTGPGVQKQLGYIDAAMKRMGTVEDFFLKYFGDLIPQTNRLATNFRNLFIAIFQPMLPTITAWFKSLADVLQGLGDFIAAHPKAAMASTIGILSGLGLAIGTLSAQAILWLNRLSIEIALLGRTAAAAAASGAAGEAAAGAEGATAGGFLGVFAKWAGSGLSRVGAGFTAMRPLLARVGSLLIDDLVPKIVPGLLRLGGAIATLGLLVWDFFKHPWNLGEWLGKLEGWFIFKFFPSVQTALENGWDKVKTTMTSLWADILGGLATLLQNLWWVVKHPWDAARVALKMGETALGSLWSTVKSDYGKTQAGVQHGLAEEAHQNVLGARATQHVHVHGGVHIHVPHGGDPKKMVSMFLDELGKQSRSALRTRGSTPNVPGFSYHEAVAVG